MKKFLLLFLVPIFLYANIGKFTAIKGEVELKRGDSVTIAKIGTVLQKNDFITTKQNSKAQIVFKDSTVFTIGKNSTLDIADYLYDETKPNENKLQLNVLKGAFSTITGKIGKLNKSKFKLKTKSASIGIRGTTIKADQTTIICTSGEIDVTTPNGQMVVVKAGFKTNVSSGTPTTPEKAVQKDLEVFNNSISDIEINLQDSVNDDNTANNINSSIPQAVSLVGKDIQTDGTSTDLNENGKVSNGKLSLDNSSLKMVDDNGQSITKADNEYITWGHWESDTTKKFIIGQETHTDTLNSLRNATTTVNAQYNGKVMGSTNTGTILHDATNNVTINFALGGGQNSMNGSMNFKTSDNQTWNVNFSGDTSANTFTNAATSGNVDGGDSINNASNNINGIFYGNDAQALGATFQLNTAGGKEATGVLKANK